MRPFLAVVVACVSLVAGFGASSASAAQITHCIVRGDTLWSLAARYHVPVAALESRNHLIDDSVLHLGDVIVVADGAPAHAVRHHVTRHASSATASSSRAVDNALWVATHTGEAPPPPASPAYALAARMLDIDAKVTRTALRFLGVPYVWGGSSFSGVDCSGFVQAVFERNGIWLPRTADSQFEVGRRIALGSLEAGDLVFFQTYAPGASHVGIYLGGGRFIHASSSAGVRVDALGEDYFASRYLGARRLIR